MKEKARKDNKRLEKRRWSCKAWSHKRQEMMLWNIK